MGTLVPPCKEFKESGPNTCGPKDGADGSFSG